MTTFSKLKSSLQDYENIFSEKKYDSLLKKAMNHGEISIIQYLTESIYCYGSLDTYLEIEHVYYLTKAKLLRHLL